MYESENIGLRSNNYETYEEYLENLMRGIEHHEGVCFNQLGKNSKSQEDLSMKTNKPEHLAHLTLPCDNGGLCPNGATSREGCFEATAKLCGVEPPCLHLGPGIINKSAIDDFSVKDEPDLTIKKFNSRKEGDVKDTVITIAPDGMNITVSDVEAILHFGMDGNLFIGEQDTGVSVFPKNSYDPDFTFTYHDLIVDLSHVALWAWSETENGAESHKHLAMLMHAIWAINAMNAGNDV